MKIPDEIIQKYGVPDPDVGLFVDHFDEPEGSRILVVGAHDEPTANMLADAGCSVVGLDLRPYDSSLPPCNYRFRQFDFCDSTVSHYGWWYGQPEVFVSLSAVEHFGLGTYNEGPRHAYYDVIAMRKAWELLKEGGRAYVTVPFGGSFCEMTPHWRVYDEVSLNERVVQDFRLDLLTMRAGEDILESHGNVLWKQGTPMSMEDAKQMPPGCPFVSALLVMTKVKVERKG